jgi:hypothetical protein
MHPCNFAASFPTTPNQTAIVRSSYPEFQAQASPPLCFVQTALP